MVKAFRDAVMFKEDVLYDGKVRDLILGVHGWEFVCERRHLPMPIVGEPNFEVDVVIAARTPKGRVRFVGIELKELDFSTVLWQAIMKKIIFFHVMYVVTASLYMNGNTLRLLKQALDEGVGIIYYRPDTCSEPILITAAKVLKPRAWIKGLKLQRRLDGSTTIVFHEEKTT